jgi:hypothetical protein
MTVPCLPIDTRPLQHVLATSAALSAPQVQVMCSIRIATLDNIVSDRCSTCKKFQRVAVRTLHRCSCAVYLTLSSCQCDCQGDKYPVFNVAGTFTELDTAELLAVGDTS